MNSMTQDETYNEASGTPDGHLNESNPDSFNGYANRETWAFNLHWQNDQGLYNETLDEARRYIEETYGKAGHLIHDEDERRAAYYGAGEHVVNYWRDYIDTLNDEFGTAPDDTLRMFDREVGSWWRIDYAEVGAAVRESLDAESD